LELSADFRPLLLLFELATVVPLGDLGIPFITEKEE